MNIEQFRILDNAEKLKVVWKKGKYLANRDVLNTLCDIYQLFDFYVAIWYELNESKKVEITPLTKYSESDLPILNIP